MTNPNGASINIKPRGELNKAFPRAVVLPFWSTAAPETNHATAY